MYICACVCVIYSHLEIHEFRQKVKLRLYMFLFSKDLANSINSIKTGAQPNVIPKQICSFLNIKLYERI